MLGADRSQGYLPGNDLADFLAGANLEGGDAAALLLAIDRLFKLLPAPQKQQFLAGLPPPHLVQLRMLNASGALDKPAIRFSRPFGMASVDLGVMRPERYAVVFEVVMPPQTVGLGLGHFGGLTFVGEETCEGV